MECLPGEGEEGVGGEAGACAVGLPFVAEETGVGVDVTVLAGVLGAGVVGTPLGVATNIVLGPETVEDEGEVLGALGGAGVGVTKLWRPGEVEEIEVEVLLDGFGRGVGGVGRLAWCCGG